MAWASFGCTKINPKCDVCICIPMHISQYMYESSYIYQYTYITHATSLFYLISNLLCEVAEWHGRLLDPLTPAESVHQRLKKKKRKPKKRHVKPNGCGWGRVGAVRIQEKACSSDSRCRRKLSGTTGHRLLGTQRPQMLCVAAWVWFCLSTEFVGAVRGANLDIDIYRYK